ncbi:winged helix-turn-helix transcriptional regulator [bacterium]|nr:winged helix-turn-helix transcriptional regulator [bacterium]
MPEKIFFYLFLAFADPTRIRLLNLLCKNEVGVGKIQRALALGQSQTSHHLGILRNIGLIEDRRIGKNVFYRIVPKKIRHVISILNRLLAKKGLPGEEFVNDLLALKNISEKRNST